VLILPEKLAAVHDPPVAEMEQIYGHQRRFGVDGHDVGVVAGSRGHFLALIHFFDRGKQVAQRGRALEFELLRRLLHAELQLARQVAGLAVQEQLQIADRARILLIRGQPFHAGAEAAVYVILQTRLRVWAGEIDTA
jgi:hypothetical protein